VLYADGVMGMRVSVVAVVRVVAVDKLDVGDRTAVIVENEPLMAELVAGIELDAAAVLDGAVMVENEPLMTELVARIEFDAGVELDADTELDPSIELDAEIELDPSTELDADDGLDAAVMVENEPLIAELVADDRLDTALVPEDDGLDITVFPEDDTADDEPVVDPDEGGGPVPARIRTPTLIVLAALLMAFCADRR